MIFNLIKKEQWDICKKQKLYQPKSIEREGYIHCSFEDQILKVAETFYKEQKNLLILCINEKKIDCEVKIEDLFNLNEKYPHVYGSLPIRSIEKVVELNIDSDGNFIKPDLKSINSFLVKQREWT